MATSSTKLPLVISQQIEAERTWEGLSTPSALLKWFVDNTSVDAKSLSSLDEFVISPTERVDKIAE